MLPLSCGPPPELPLRMASPISLASSSPHLSCTFSIASFAVLTVHLGTHSLFHCRQNESLFFFFPFFSNQKCCGIFKEIAVKARLFCRRQNEAVFWIFWIYCRMYRIAETLPVSDIAASLLHLIDRLHRCFNNTLRQTLPISLPAERKPFPFFSNENIAESFRNRSEACLLRHRQNEAFADLLDLLWNDFSLQHLSCICLITFVTVSTIHPGTLYLFHYRQNEAFSILLNLGNFRKFQRIAENPAYFVV